MKKITSRTSVDDEKLQNMKWVRNFCGHFIRFLFCEIINFYLWFLFFKLMIFLFRLSQLFIPHLEKFVAFIQLFRRLMKSKNLDYVIDAPENDRKWCIQGNVYGKQFKFKRCISGWLKGKGHSLVLRLGCLNEVYFERFNPAALKQTWNWSICDAVRKKECWVSNKILLVL